MKKSIFFALLLFFPFCIYCDSIENISDPISISSDFLIKINRLCEKFHTGKDGHFYSKPFDKCVEKQNNSFEFAKRRMAKYSEMNFFRNVSYPICLKEFKKSHHATIFNDCLRREVESFQLLSSYQADPRHKTINHIMNICLLEGHGYTKTLYHVKRFLYYGTVYQGKKN